MPSPLVSVWEPTPVLVLVIVIATPGITAPEASLTRPTMELRSRCPKANPPSINRAQHSDTTLCTKPCIRASFQGRPGVADRLKSIDLPGPSQSVSDSTYPPLPSEAAINTWTG